MSAAALLLALPGHAADVIAIVGATVIHPERELPAAVAANSTVIISGKRIERIGPAGSTKVPAGAAVIDGKGKWVVPGLIDAHVHFFQSGNLYTRPDVADFNAVVPYAKEVERNKARLPATFKVWLASGVTSVVDIGGPMWNFEMRDAALKSPAAPRVAVAGPLISMIDRAKLDLGDPPIIKVSSADEARALVARELARKPDFIKVWFIHQPGDDLAAQEAIVKATGDAAHAAGVRLAVHATELIVAKASLRAGADFLVHSVQDEAVDEEFLALAKKNRALYCPTLFVTLGYRYALSNTWQPTEAERRLADPQIVAAMSDLQRIPSDKVPERVAKAMSKPVAPAVTPLELQNLRKVWDAGITVVMGTDAGNIGTLHGPSVFREMPLMVQAGLTPLQVLRSATANGAKATRLEREIGTLAAGKLADVVILDADPLADVGNLSRIHRVIKDGKLFVPDQSSLFIEDLTSPEVKQAIAAGKTTAIYYAGSTEQNGPHMALGKHNFVARYVAGRIAEQLGNALVYPVLPFAPTGEHMKFPGTVNLSDKTFGAVAQEVAQSAIAAGFKHVVLMGDHGGGQDALKQVASALDGKGARVHYIGDVYFQSQAPHAGVEDTSELMFIDRDGKWIRRDKLDSKASAELGRKLVEKKVDSAVAQIRTLVGK